MKWILGTRGSALALWQARHVKARLEKNCEGLEIDLQIIKTRGAFPSDEAATKLLYLALRNLGVHWKPAIEWRAAYAQFVIFFAERLPTTIR